MPLIFESIKTSVTHMQQPIKKIAVLTSGGDSPGMNAAIRAVVRTGIYHQLEVYGVYRGYEGLIENDIHPMTAQSVSNIIQRGGTILKTARSKRFLEKEGQQVALDNLKALGIDGLVVIGGDGSFRGAEALSKLGGIKVIGVPGTIDKDIAGTDSTIGFDTAVNTAIEAIDRIRDTADAHDRIFVVEVMGRDAGYIALHSAIACGAEDVLLPEIHTDIAQVLDNVCRNNRRQKNVHIIIVAEGDDYGDGEAVTARLKERFKDKDIKTAILGHIQRGGSPTCADRILASRMGHGAVEGLLSGKNRMMVGVINNQIHYTSFEKSIKGKLTIPDDMLPLVPILSV